MRIGRMCARYGRRPKRCVMSKAMRVLRTVPSEWDILIRQMLTEVTVWTVDKTWRVEKLKLFHMLPSPHSLMDKWFFFLGSHATFLWAEVLCDKTQIINCTDFPVLFSFAMTLALDGYAYFQGDLQYRRM